MNTRIVKLSEQQANELAGDLNKLLSSFQVYYQNLRGFHWNIKGRNFFELHLKFEELYLDTQEKIDLVAERILTLEHSPLHTFKDYLAHSTIPVAKDIFKDEHAVISIVTALEELLKQESNLLAKTADFNDEGTNSMMSDFMAEQEKTLWMFKSWLA